MADLNLAVSNKNSISAGITWDGIEQADSYLVQVQYYNCNISKYGFDSTMFSSFIA